uniref:Zinc finger PMZ-type domain-containing protein n=1 Tax=Lactuca sativa TaxID=4236 RepID=A0A9R1VSW8_LACSA|nr:hypothetical protein LSAT_V11C400185510 [Lactuca sativa]
MYYTCRPWELSGIPYVHAQATIIYTQQDPTRFIITWFGKDKFLATYEFNILPVNGSNMWEPTPYTKPLPPVKRRMAGRPCMKRKRHVSEHQDRFSQVSSKGRTVQCQNFMQMGHNKVSSKNPSFKPTPNPKKKIGRPRLNPELTNCTRRGRGGGRGCGRGVRRGGRSGGRGSTSVYEEGESSGKKEPGIEAQFVTQTTPNDVSFVSEHVPETQEENDENKEESDYEDGVEESQEDNDEDGSEDDEEGVDDTQVRVRTQVMVRTSNPSERITENMLKKIMVGKKGIGMAPENLLLWIRLVRI